MNINIELIDPLSFPDWDELILKHPDYTVFHTTHWAKVLKSTYKYIPYYFLLKTNEYIIGMLPFMQVVDIFFRKKGTSLPFSDYCPPLIFDDTINRDVIIESILSCGRMQNWRSVEIRDMAEIQHYSGSAGTKEYIKHILTLNHDSEELFNNLKSCNKRNIVKARKNGVIITYSTTYQSLGEFYRLHCLTRKKHGIPPQPILFFKNIWKYMLKKRMGYVSLASINKQVIAGAIFFHFGHKALFKFGASNNKYVHVRPNNLVLWDAIMMYAKKGYTDFSFGRTAPENKGLLAFKSQWGAGIKKIVYHIFYLKGRPEKHLSTQSGLTKVMRYLPVSCLRIIGRVLYRFMG